MQCQQNIFISRKTLTQSGCVLNLVEPLVYLQLFFVFKGIGTVIRCVKTKKALVRIPETPCSTSHGEGYNSILVDGTYIFIPVCLTTPNLSKFHNIMLFWTQILQSGEPNP